jgi:hypothetical protein
MPERLSVASSIFSEYSERVTEHPLRGFWLSYKLPRGSEIKPFRSVMSLPDRHAANSIIATAGKFFEGDYLQERSKVEKWLRTESEAKGLNLDINNPIYFFLYRKPLRIPLPGKIIINLPAINVPADKMTFTFDDSFHNYSILEGRTCSTTPPNINPRIFTAAELSQDIYNNGFLKEFDGNNPDRYIECQLWAHNLPIFNRVTEALTANRSQLDEIDILTFT